MMHAFPRTFTLPADGLLRAVAEAHPAPLTPAAYLRMRREAAGLTERRVAGMLARKADDIPAALDLVHVLETPGNVARRPETLETLRDIFPFDPDLYRQLASAPADQHPRVCRSCGCSQWDPCGDEQDACSWSSDIACTRCLPDVAPMECCQ